MGISWKTFEMPKKLESDEKTYSECYGKFIAEPFERGFGTTIGNSLRRILISSIEGAAVTSVKIDGVLHEFSTIPGVLEDIPQIVLNIKQLVLRSHSRTPKILYLKASKKGEVTAKDIITDDTVEIINPDLHIATLTKDTSFNMELEIGKGRGFVSSERNKKEGQAIGIIPVDSVFAPVRRVNFHVEETRVGQITDYDRLIINIWTNGSIDPKEALLYASHILQRHLEIFSKLGEVQVEEEEEENKEDKELLEKLNLPVSELELSVRSNNCLREARIKTIGELVRKTEQDMLQYRNFGKKSLTEIKEILKGMGLSFGMEMPKETKKGK
ncbi:MAG: DNA-directed RNA polymerase subunit alpha [Candidatus Omnitrophica bacterium]|nr:DNA-directed RNA polymerase subunit alpha [Candidatus Omnitrophota bacterium]MBU1853536.1 DNA-directed RNA polymerase subunit alpha [Candidatus Omnitrophota bacterium]